MKRIVIYRERFDDLFPLSCVFIKMKNMRGVLQYDSMEDIFGRTKIPLGNMIFLLPTTFH